MNTNSVPFRFALGQLVATPTVLEAVPHSEIIAALDRHLACDWGDMCAEDQQSNDWALQHECRLFSVYHAKDGTTFWIITEADRSATTVLLPSDY